MKTINKSVLTKLKDMGFAVKILNNKYTFLHKGAEEGIIVDDTTVDNFAYIDGERILGEASSETISQAMYLLQVELCGKPVESQKLGPHAEITTVSDNVLVKSEIKIGDIEQKSIDNHPGTIAALLMLQNTPDDLVLSRKGQGGKMLSYVEGAEMTKMANFAFLFNWSVKDVSIREDDKEFSAIVACDFTFTEGYTVTKTQVGSANKKYSKTLKNDDGAPQIIMIGDTIKSAITDGTKKCMSALGICQDVYSGAHKAAGLK